MRQSLLCRFRIPACAPKQGTFSYICFYIHTDHSSLAWLFHLKAPQDKLVRWLEELNQYDSAIENHPGQQHRNADAMSR